MRHLSRLCTPCWFSPYPDGIAGELSAKNLKSGGTLENWKDDERSKLICLRGSRLAATMFLKNFIERRKTHEEPEDL